MSAGGKVVQAKEQIVTMRSNKGRPALNFFSLFHVKQFAKGTGNFGVGRILVNCFAEAQPSAVVVSRNG
jgi:hypothetical protein